MQTMQTRILGYTGEQLTTVGLGTWALGGGHWAFGWGTQDDAESGRAIGAALESGVNWIDTAAVYGLGHAEEVVGRALKELPERPFIATKCGQVWDASRRTRPCLKADSVRSECEASLKRLGLETIDLYQIHWPRPEEEIEEGWGAIAELIREGKVRYGGVSNFSVEQMERVRRIHPIASLQPPYSMLERDVEKELLAHCAEHDIGVIAYSPLQKGLLTGKIDRAYVDAMDDTDHRKTRDPMFQEPDISRILGKVERLKPIAERLGITLAQLAVAWVLRRTEVTAAIVGARRPDQIRGIAPAAEIAVPDKDLAEIKAVLEDS